jgi:hypothetical protein
MQPNSTSPRYTPFVTIRLCEVNHDLRPIWCKVEALFEHARSSPASIGTASFDIHTYTKRMMSDAGQNNISELGLCMIPLRTYRQFALCD